VASPLVPLVPTQFRNIERSRIMSRSHVLRFASLASIGLALTALLAGCRHNSSTSAQFTPSTTAPAPGLIKLVERTRSGSRVAVDVILFGPEPALDLFAFKFAIKIGDSDLVGLVAQSSHTQTALVSDAGQTILIDVDGTADPSLVQVDVEKQGGGAGNGFAAASAVVIELTFEVRGSGATSLTLTGVGNDPPQAVDSSRAPIGEVAFDGASATVRGVTTGGGY
jgi:hypothetical protein